MEILGRKSPRFSVPVCAEADLGSYGRRLGWREALQGGLSLAIDTNEEYDVKNLLTRNREKKINQPNIFKAYPDSREQSDFSILLGTISIALLSYS